MMYVLYSLRTTVVIDLAAIFYRIQSYDSSSSVSKCRALCVKQFKMSSHCALASRDLSEQVKSMVQQIHVRSIEPWVTVSFHEDHEMKQSSVVSTT